VLPSKAAAYAGCSNAFYRSTLLWKFTSFVINFGVSTVICLVG